MTDLNKEREAFEKLSEIAEILNEEKSHFNGDFYDLPFNSCAESFINGAWYAWQEKAKAQTVPETHIVVPKQPTPKMIDATWDFDDEIIEMSSNTRNEFIWKKMVEASESGAEQ
ncbi:hypothetical protein [Acinetobacter baumannii]|uniref:hypothetical protein n=1 Tax=Acinetobacter baumannii TaxID=470 RepID=UPI0016604894|nr:hypothetical protein [Acinetobacter baumannii]MBD0543640.1 hypothetical protein [Acinetobacter baumannii]MDR9518278.1 hypothetical protein [Acinetobacter baumannii]